MRKAAILAMPVVLALGLGVGACDGEDYEARVAGLESELETTRGDLAAARSEAEDLRRQLEELPAEAERQGQASGEELESAMRQAIDALARTEDRLSELARTAAEAGEETTSGIVDEMRASLSDAAEAVGDMARSMGMEEEGFERRQ